MLASRDRNAAETFQFRVTVNIVGDHRFFQPAQIEWLQQREHAFGVIEIPTHIRVSHDINLAADGFANRLDKFDIALHSSRAISRSPAKTHFHRLIAFILVALRFSREFVRWRAVKTARIYGNSRFSPPTQQAEHRLLRGPGDQIPQRNIHRADCHHSNALPAKGHGFAIHVLPQEFDVPGVRADEQWLQIEIDHLLCHRRRKRGVSYPYEAIVAEDLDDEPSVKRKR